MLAWPLLIRRVSGASMTPTFRSGQLVLGRRTSKVKEKDIVIAFHDNREIIKRVLKINPKEVLLIGDNAPYSTDGRSYGYIPIENIVAKVIWPRI